MSVTQQFAARLRADTRANHREAEESAFLCALLQGRLGRKAYAALLEQLVAVYACLDTAAAGHRENPRFGGFFDQRLARGTALAQDLAVLGTTGGELLSATTDYCLRLTRVASDPLLVLAHHYTRYLGDLSGGQAIARVLEQTMLLTPEAGLAFYQFDVGPAARYKRAYRERLDALELSEDDRGRLVGEVQAAFSLNKGVFTGLESML